MPLEEPFPVVARAVLKTDELGNSFWLIVNHEWLDQLKLDPGKSLEVPTYMLKPGSTIDIRGFLSEEVDEIKDQKV